MANNSSSNLITKKQAAIFVDRKSIESHWINVLTAHGYDIDVLLSNKKLFEDVLEGYLNLIVVDSELLSEDPAMIERYKSICPQLFIIVLGSDSHQKDKYKEAGCSRYMEPLALFDGFDHAVTFEKDSSEIISLTPLFDGWRLSKTNYNLYTPNKTKIKLTVREFKLLELLFQSTLMVSKHEIQHIIIGHNCDTGDQRIAVMITRLRKKVLQQSSCQLPIKSDYTNGYVFAGPCSIESR
ncbi:MAG: winged helix-turn-helix domain-containing protein [Methylococcaceae bacterium]